MAVKLEITMAIEERSAEALQYYLRSHDRVTMAQCLKDALGVVRPESVRRGEQMWVAAYLRYFGYHRKSVRQGYEVVRMWVAGPDSARLLAMDMAPRHREVVMPYVRQGFIEVPRGNVPSRAMLELEAWLKRREWHWKKACEMLDVSEHRMTTWRKGLQPVPRVVQLAMRFFDLQAQIVSGVTPYVAESVDNPPAPCSDTPNVDDDESTRSTPDVTEHPVSPV